ncbi:MAG: VWA domain-containing protein [Armatimonadetes bacterium]|nr:VWA domain-containing protein [Armatimonadota bacterium]
MEERREISCRKCLHKNLIIPDATGPLYCELCGATLDPLCPQCGDLHRPGPCPSRRKKRGKTLGWFSAAATLLLGLGFLLKMITSGALGDYQATPRIDVVFLVDTTGSMGDEISVVKDKIGELMDSVEGGTPKPLVRYSIVAYRDRGEDYVVKKFPLASDRKQIAAWIQDIQADGGGDLPESVNEALHAAVQEMNWDLSPRCERILFLIGDAGPHLDYSQDYSYKKEANRAREKGISIHAIGCSGLDPRGEQVFRYMAQETGGKFDFLTYHQQVTTDSGETCDVVTYGGKDYKLSGSGSDRWREGRRFLDEEKPKAAPSSLIRNKPCGILENNLDTVLTEAVKQKAQDRGVSY